MSGYSFRGVPIGRMTPPSPYQLTSAVNRERDMTALMNRPGAAEMIGYRFAAEVDRELAERDYLQGVAQHNETLMRQRDEDYERLVADRDARQRHALMTTAINNPLGAALSDDPSVYSLITPQAREQLRMRPGIDNDVRMTQAEAAMARAQAQQANLRADTITLMAERNYQNALNQWNTRLQMEYQRYTNERRHLLERQLTMRPDEFQRQLAELDARHQQRLAEINSLRPTRPGEAPVTPETQMRPEAMPQQQQQQQQQQQTDTLPPEARSRLREGVITTFNNGQKWTLRNGEPVRLQ